MFFIVRRRHFLVALLCVAALGLGMLSVTRVGTALSVATNAANTNWGLRFGKNGETPVGNASAEFLKQYDACYTGDTTEKVLYLTFDAGYDNGYTAGILDTLKKHGVPAAFFIVGNFLETQPELTKRMVAEGHIVANHTYHHPDMSAIRTAADFNKELTLLETKFKEITGAEMPKFYRPPQGKYSEENLKLAKAAGYKTVLWSLAYVDWYVDDQPTSDEAFAKLLPRTHAGAVVLLHSTSRTNCQILDELITKWKEMGYTFGALTDL